MSSTSDDAAGSATETAGREHALIETFVELADTLVDGYDVVDLLHRLVRRCASTLGAVDAGILLAGDDGSPRVVASTSERSHLIGLLQLDAAQGPCLDAFLTGRLVTVEDIAGVYARWPEFATEAGQLGYQAMHAIPLRLRQQVLGSLNLFNDRVGPLSPSDAGAAQGLADIATIGIVHERALRHSEVVREQLQSALTSRVLVEQAKGVLAQTEGVDMDEAFRRIRARARNSGSLLSEVARTIVDSASRR